MKNAPEILGEIRGWILKNNPKVDPAALTDQTRILEERIISSVQIMDLLLFLEDLRGTPIEIDDLKAGTFQDIQSIYSNFFEGAR
jgi:acyl carrier protein